MAHLPVKKIRLAVFFTLLFSGVFFLRIFLPSVFAATLSCTVTTSCPSGVVIYRMSGTTNAHSELPSQSNYSQLVCCTGVVGLANTCTDTNKIAVRLSGATNAHIEQNTQTNYANNACLSVPTGGTVTVGYQSSNCSGFDTTLGSMSATTNAVAGDASAYTTKICASMTSVAENFAQNYFRFYVDNDALLPTDPWPPGATDIGENTSITSADNPIASGEKIRIRMSLQTVATTTIASAHSFRLQYGTLVSTCGAIASWTDIGAPGSGTIWRGFNATPADGTALSGNPPTAGDLKLSVSDRAATYEEANDTAVNPFAIAVGEDAEYDWELQDNGAAGTTNYCFRIASSSSLALGSYNFYPVVRTAGFRPKSQNWQWYDDETNETPSTALAAENIAPANIENDNTIKLRLTVKETANIAGGNTKFKLQFSQFSDFSSGVFTVDATSTCTGSSSWCYADGAGADNAIITTKVLSDPDACSGGVGDGCGTHNEASSTASTFTHIALAATEYEFGIKQSGASPNTVYYFRAYDTVNDVPVILNTGESYPSLSTKGGVLTFTIGGLSSGTVTEGVTTDITTTATSIPFGTLAIGSEIEGAQRATTTTDASNGYQVFVRQESGFLSNNGAEIFGVTGTNASPSAWATGCPSSAAGCYGYHAGDDTLAGGSSRFLTDDTYAKLEDVSKEVVFSSVGVTDEVIDIIFKTQITNQQAAGTYDSTLMYIVVPVF